MSCGACFPFDERATFKQDCEPMASLLPPQAPSPRVATSHAPAAWIESLPFAWRYPRWNFSRHAATFRAADAFVVSIQKSGRTWVRVFLTAYFSEWGKQNFSPAARPAAAAAMPALCYTHDLWEHKAKERFGERLRGKWLIPREECLNKPILLVVRDPRDQMVSLFFHLKKRTGTFKGDLSALLRHRIFGVERVVNIMNRWILEWVDHSRLHVLRYEDARRDPEPTFAAALRFLLPTLALDPAALTRAVEISSFENMRRLEAGAQGAQGTELVVDLNTEALRPKDAADPESYKVRRGKVGGFADYLAAEDIAYLNSVVATLDPRYGYGQEPSVAD